MNHPIKVLFVVGTRPEAIKLAPVINAMKARCQEFLPTVCATGQHREMLSSALNAFEIAPEFSLNAMQSNQNLNDLNAILISGIDKIIDSYKPELTIVQGDTNSAFSGAISSFYRRIPIAHIEAGLRTNDLNSPFPEEGNRLLIDKISNYFYAPTIQNKINLINENTSEESIIITGNTGIDALLWMKEKITKNQNHKHNENLLRIWPEFAVTENPLALITLHRREIFGAALHDLFHLISTFAGRYPTWNFLYPVHLNPNVLTPAKKAFKNITNVHLCEPLEYPEFVHAMIKATLILTDSGGIQEEAPSLHKPVFVLRDVTERQEAVDAGTVVLTGTSPESVRAAVEPYFSDIELSKNWPIRKNPYGDGNATDIIINDLLKRLRDSK